MEAPVFSPEWLRKMETAEQNAKCNRGDPVLLPGYYAFLKTSYGWAPSNGRCLWDNPVLVEEIHEYKDGSTSIVFYVEGLPQFGKKKIEAQGMKAARGKQLRSFLPVTKIVYFDHKHLEGGKARRRVHENGLVTQQEGESAE